MHLYGSNIPQRAVSEGAPLTAVTSTCQIIEPEADVDNTQVNRSTAQSLQAADSITQVSPLTFQRGSKYDQKKEEEIATKLKSEEESRRVTGKKYKYVKLVCFMHMLTFP